MDFIGLETYLALAETRNLTRAAANLCVSQSTVTHRLKKLEEELQYPLFVRRPGVRKIELTSQGEDFRYLAKRWLELYRETELLKFNSRQILSIAAMDSIALTVLPPAVKQLVATESALNVKIEIHHSPEIYELVRRQEADLGFVAFDLHDPELVAEEIFRQKFYLLKPCRCPGPRRSVHMADLDPGHEIFQSWGLDYLKWHDQHLPVSTVPRMNVDSVHSLMSYMDNEQSWCIVQTSVVKEIQKYIPVQVYDILDDPPEWVCYRIRHKFPNKKHAAGVKAFEKLLKAHLETSDILADNF